MKKVSLIFFFVLFIHHPLIFSQSSYQSQIEDLAKSLSAHIDSNSNKRVAIMGIINNEKKITQLGEIIAEDLSAELANHSNNQKKFEVFERERLEEIFKEKKLIKNYDSRDAKELGKLNAVDILMLGTIIPFEEFNRKYYKITIKLLDTKNGSILSSVKAQIEKNNSLDKLYGNSGEEPAPKETELKKIIPPPPIVPVVSNPCPLNTGKIVIKNLTQIYLFFYISSHPIKLDQLPDNAEFVTVSPNSEDFLPGVKPGLYYICATNGDKYECIWNKKVEVEGCKDSFVKIQ